MDHSEEIRKKPNLRERRSKLRQLRKVFDLSLEELAKRSGLSKSMISKFELGHRDLSASAWGRLEKALNTLQAKRVMAAIGPFDRDYVAYKDFLRDEPKLHQRIGRIVHCEKVNLRQRDLLVEVLRRLSSGHKGGVVKHWYEAERDALLAFKKIGELDARVSLELGIKLWERFRGVGPDQLREEIRKVREQVGMG
jgi:transcriptional regulator with XRE-family HTH domain